MLQVKSLTKSFDGFKAVNNANLDVQNGEIVAVIGPNGAGKTTLFNLISGILKPDSGQVLFKGDDITGLPPYEICRKRISRSFQVVNVFNRLSIFENTQISILSRQKKTWNLFTPSSSLAVNETNELLKNVGLYEKRDHISGALSHGDRKVLEIAMALGGNPEFLILDEPTAGMSPEETTRCIDLIKGLREKYGLTILFCEHDMEIVFGIASRIMVMVRGGTIVQGTCEEVRCNEAVQDAYLGGSDVCLM
ncbi:MAG TPA: ABC transporter ATP-binding protein [Syntrophorhabdus sp.]|nr:ABC transporter ATP-binding protein [Syntrophorhabdus sp.]OPX93663.1 MAG: Lipopolysaccharide export system ATP-binding protein LptB [Syntrophorhabdus sp. PtaB.Bin027]OQB75337.1 MAG: Lipopolysaccharide export system ATP-binding protein LptB [Deltaproteobacteria bacterium ADurb.Bin135]MBP8744457.1 ABC transporter ATP-binding protein [Syntrophorhabdus sp.]NMC93883.1 ABC transporter ATP-binding protein [Syntrophorhabdus sp.]